VQENLKWNCDRKTADRICNFNRHYAEFAGYWMKTSFMEEVDKDNITTYYDSVTGKPLFRAPIGRSFEEFKKESEKHGWPSFRDEEVVWENMRCLPNGEAISVDGTHLGHNLPDRNGNRYCINLVSVAGRPVDEE
jgi:peptide methionine sulfoxide reductase MsrB